MKKNSKNEYLYTRGALVHLCDYNGTVVCIYDYNGSPCVQMLISSSVSSKIRGNRAILDREMTNISRMFVNQ